jgi:hypothetical protein
MKKIELSIMLIFYSLLLVLVVNAQSINSSIKSIEISPTRIITSITCTACVGGTPTGQKDSNGCPIYSCPTTKQCPINCTCSGDTVTCPIEQKTCPAGCTCSGDVVTCPIEPPKACSICLGGEPTGRTDSNGCPIYSCPTTKQCPINCTCSGDTVTCPIEPFCKSPCVKSGDTCTCPVEPPTTCNACVNGTPTGQKDSNGCPIYSCPQKQCPAGCTCSGDTVACTVEGTKPIEAEISSRSGTRTVSIEKVPNGLSLQSEKTTAITTENLVIEGNKLSLKTSTGNKEIKVLPEEASSKATAVTKVNTIELKEESQQPIYSVKGTTQAKLLFVIPVSMQIETKISADSGNVISVNKPWWGFLTR